MLLIVYFSIVINVIEGIHLSDQKITSSDDTLTPYVNVHGSRLNYRSIRDCHLFEHGTPAHEIYKSHKSLNISSPFVKIHRFVKELSSAIIPIGLLRSTESINKRVIRGHYAVISNPMQTLSILEPDHKGGCSEGIRQTVRETAKKNNCLFAVNAGYFDTKQGTCLGNVISNGEKAHNSKGIQNVNFGLTENGNIFIGYVSEEMFLSNEFEQLVGGVVWILRNSSDYVNVSKDMECEETEETGPMKDFISILSARTSVGHDKDGNIIVVQIDGKSNLDGVSLIEMQDILRDFGIINAINLDGGGSATMVYDGVTINYPYDTCPDDSAFGCDRKVSTILCVHEPYCEPKNCNNHGKCEMGVCVCEKNWLPPSCHQLSCEKDKCSSHGSCTENGCLCDSGYYGENCDKVCLSGKYGNGCVENCNCMNKAECDSVTGICICRAGFSGENCQFVCQPGFFGKNCSFQCQCNEQCFCDPVTGSCEYNKSSSIFLTASCLANDIIQEQKLVKDDPTEKRKWYTTMIILGVITAVCITAVLLLMFCSCSCRCQNEQVLCASKQKKTIRKYRLRVPSGDLSDSSESDTVSMKILQKR